MHTYKTKNGEEVEKVLLRDKKQVIDYLKTISFGRTKEVAHEIQGWTFYFSNNCVSAHYLDESATQADFAVPTISRWIDGRISESYFVRWSIEKCGWCGNKNIHNDLCCAYCGGS